MYGRQRNEVIVKCKKKVGGGGGEGVYGQAGCVLRIEVIVKMPKKGRGTVGFGGGGVRVTLGGRVRSAKK